MPLQDSAQTIEEEKPPLEPIDLDAILPELGPFGCYQKFVFSYLAVAILFTSINNCQFIFNAGRVAYR